MAGGSLESILRCSHEILNTYEIRDRVGEKGKKGVRDLSSLSPLLHLFPLGLGGTTCVFFLPSWLGILCAVFILLMNHIYDQGYELF